MSKMMRFTFSTALAINELNRLLSGSIDGAPRPCWSNFLFFSDIEPLNIRRVRRFEQRKEYPGYWTLSRTVNFYRHRQLVAAVQLAGKKTDTIAKSCGRAGSCEADTVFWGVCSIEYAPADDTPRDQWVKVDMPATVGLMAGTI